MKSKTLKDFVVIRYLNYERNLVYVAANQMTTTFIELDKEAENMIELVLETDDELLESALNDKLLEIE